MIIPNGTIEVRTHKVEQGLDGDGFPISQPSAKWGVPIACQYLQNRYSNIGYSKGGAFTPQEYTILIEERESHKITSEQVRLRDKGGREIGEFTIKSREPLVAVGQECITL